MQTFIYFHLSNSRGGVNKRGHGAKNFSVYKEIGFFNHSSAKVAKSLNKTHKKEGILQKLINMEEGGKI